MATGALTEEIAANLEEAAEMTRQIDSRAVGLFVGGVCVGAALGFIFGFRWNREKIRAEAFAQSEKEIEEMREIYQAKTVAAQPKPSVEEVVIEKGYTITETEVQLPGRPTKPPVPVREAEYSYTEAVPVPEDEDDGEPYVITQDEFNTSETGYTQAVFTYWDVDDVLSDMNNQILHEADGLVGAKQLAFGQGSDDEDVVFVRNDHLELEMEICRVHKSYGFEVMGIGPDPELEHSSYPKKRSRKRRN